MSDKCKACRTYSTVLILGWCPSCTEVQLAAAASQSEQDVALVQQLQERLAAAEAQRDAEKNEAVRCARGWDDAGLERNRLREENAALRIHCDKRGAEIRRLEQERESVRASGLDEIRALTRRRDELIDEAHAAEVAQSAVVAGAAERVARLEGALQGFVHGTCRHLSPEETCSWRFTHGSMADPCEAARAALQPRTGTDGGAG